MDKKISGQEAVVRQAWGFSCRGPRSILGSLGVGGLRRRVMVSGEPGRGGTR